jgi:hypothetical protein
MVAPKDDSVVLASATTPRLSGQSKTIRHLSFSSECIQNKIRQKVEKGLPRPFPRALLRKAKI